MYILCSVVRPRTSRRGHVAMLPMTAQSCPEALHHLLNDESAISASACTVELPTVAVTESYQPLTSNLTKFPNGGVATEEDKQDAAAAVAEQQQCPQRIDTSAMDGIRTIACITILTNHWLEFYGRKKHGGMELQVRKSHGKKNPRAS